MQEAIIEKQNIILNKLTELSYNELMKLIAELLYSLKILSSDIKYKTRYEAFLGRLVYNRNPPSWEHRIESLQALSKVMVCT